MGTLESCVSGDLHVGCGLSLISRFVTNHRMCQMLSLATRFLTSVTADLDSDMLIMGVVAPFK